MNTKLHYVFVFFCLINFIIACDRPDCENSNPVFEKFLPGSKQYKDELVKQLNLIENSGLRYWLEKYEEKDGQEYLSFFVQGDGLCARIILTVKPVNKIRDVLDKKGVGYRGAEFKNLKFDIIQDSVQTEFVYKDFDRIID